MYKGLKLAHLEETGKTGRTSHWDKEKHNMVHPRSEDPDIGQPHSEELYMPSKSDSPTPSVDPSFPTDLKQVSIVVYLLVEFINFLQVSKLSPANGGLNGP